MRTVKPREIFNKMNFLIIGSAFITIVIIFRLFELQIIKHKQYQTAATISQHGFIEIPSQRGDIMIKDHHSQEEFPVATNTTLNLLFADPALIDDPLEVAARIAPLLLSIENERAKDNERIEETAKKLAPELSPEEIDELLKPTSDADLANQFRQDLTDKISQQQRQQILLGTNFESATLMKINALSLRGIEVIDDDVYAYPPQISSVATTARKLAEPIEIPSKRLETILKGENRYVVLARKLAPEVSEQIQTLTEEEEDLFKGINMREEYFRYYPEASLAANIIGYVNHADLGQYGLESAYNTQLAGVDGKLSTKKDSIGRQITVGESDLQAAVDGDNIVLTIDRSIQLQVEKILGEAVDSYRADSGQVLIMNPQTGAITAMAHYPSFDPNEYGKVFKKIEISLSPEEIDSLVATGDPGIYFFYVNEITLDRYLIFEEKDEDDNLYFTRYENFRGPEVYHNKIISWPYEPGSVFKSIAMAAAIDDGDVTPNTTFNDSGPIGVDFNVYTEKFDFEIKNSENDYHGLVDMTTVLAKSLNTGMTFISKEMGASLFYSYLKKFGFLDRTDIEFDGESQGQIEYFEDWTESELATHAFGQGITVTMLQLANAYGVLANGGILMQPYVIDEIHHDDGSITKSEPFKIRRVISEDTASKMTAMLTYSTEEGVANRAQVPNHFVAGKTGTSQTYKHGKALSGAGTTITSFAGYGPVNDPQFVILVKLDHPRVSEWGSATAAPTFSKIADYLYNYYNIQPDK